MAARHMSETTPETSLLLSSIPDFCVASGKIDILPVEMSNLFAALIENFGRGKICQLFASVIEYMIAFDIAYLYPVALYMRFYDLDHVPHYITIIFEK